MVELPASTMAGTQFYLLSGGVARGGYNISRLWSERLHSLYYGIDISGRMMAFAVLKMTLSLNVQDRSA
jgi:hypothetical protein